MRNDVKLGFAIGGVLLAVLIVYVLVVPGGSNAPKKTSSNSTAQTGSASANGSRSGAGGGAGPVKLEPIVPPPAGTASGSSTSVPAVPPPSYADAGKLAAAQTPAAPKTDPFARPDAGDNAAAALARAGAKPDDWNTILNQQPMLMTETPVASTAGNPKSPATPSLTPVSDAKSSAGDSTPSAPSAPAASSDASNDSSSAAGAATKPSGEGSSASALSSSSGAAGTHTHRVQPGETLSSISTAAYGSPAYYPAIVKANPGIDPQRLKVGMTINLPDASAVKPSASDATHASARIPAGTGSASSAATLDSTTQYKVQPGDSLHKISIKLYGKSSEADKLYQLNKQLIGDDPHRLKVGQVLKLPEPPTITAATSASR